MNLNETKKSQNVYKYCQVVYRQMRVLRADSLLNYTGIVFINKQFYLANSAVGQHATDSSWPITATVTNGTGKGLPDNGYLIISA